MDAPIIDRATLDTLKATTGDAFVRELVDAFVSDAPSMLAGLREALAKGDAESFRRTAHSLKSNATTFGALPLAAQAKALEHGGMAPVREANGAPLDALEIEFARAADALTELARG